MQDIVSKLIKDKRAVDLYILARHIYRCGDSLISDESYRTLDTTMNKFNATPIVNQSYDDDDVPIELLKEFNLTSYIYKLGASSKYSEILREDKSMSIESIENYHEAHKRFMETPEEDKFMSAKINGVNLRLGYVADEFSISMTRGRDGEAFDVTSNMSKIIPLKINSGKNELVVYGEGVTETEHFKEIPKNQFDKFTSERSAALSMLRVTIDDYYYNYLHYLAFNADGLSDTVSGTFKGLRDLGFETPPSILIKAEEVPKDFNDFCIWLKEKMDYIFYECKKAGFPSDGAVVELNSREIVGKISGQYSTRNMALKFEQWAFEYQVGIVKDIVMEQQSVNASFVIEIEPMIVDGGITQKRITCYNPSYIVNNNVTKGSRIYYERDSGAIAKPIFGERLRKLLNGEDSSLRKLSNFQ
jgi:NAD-dependent DNA ligase